MIFTIITFVFTLLTLVVIHEFGHFYMAKKFGIKVEEFGFGLPPRIFGKKIGETIYSINWLPIGGFVRLLGEDETEKKVLENPRSFASAFVWKRIAVVVAGVVMNFFLAFLLFYIYLGAQNFSVTLPYTGQYNFIGATQKTEQFILVGSVSHGSPADLAGIKPSDQIVAINQNVIKTNQELIDETKSLAGQEISITLKDQSENSRIVKLIPRKDPPAGEGAMGIAFGSVSIANISYDSPAQKIFSGPIHSLNLIGYSFVSLGDLVGKSIQAQSFKPVSGAVAGPVGITNIANDILTTQNPLIPYLGFVGLISLNLAVFNFLPIPALDGGRLFFLLIEGVTRKKVHPTFEKWVHTVGMGVLLLLSLLVTVSDIRKIL
ncbi:MAG: M50 family metallopeptidase [Candidatus Daviesbacteria bacterium]|nr:M50 family metallopeptidase [Candidatus Daviesbacteria bacterium]